MRINVLLLALCCITTISYSQNSVNSSGADLSGSGTLNYSIGQLSTKTIAGNGNLFQGVQMAAEYLVVGIDDVINISNASIVYPNPTVNNTTLEITSPKSNTKYVLYNSQGSQLMAQDVNNSKTVIPTNTLSKGVYYLQVIDQDNTSKIFRIIKK